jgi:hypothetical protein
MTQVNEKAFDDRKGSDFESRATSDVEKKKLGISNDADVVGNIKKVAAEIEEQAQASDMSEEPIDEPSNAESDADENAKEIAKKKKQKMNSRIVDKSEGEHLEHMKEQIFARLHELMNEKLDALKVAIALKERVSFSEAEETEAESTESYPLLKPGEKLKPIKLKEDEAEQIDEASNVIKAGRTKIVKVRVRKGKVQRRKKVSAVKGYTIRGGRLTRMKASERLKRKIGQRRGKIKRKAKMARALMRRKRSMRKRASLGLKE